MQDLDTEKQRTAKRDFFRLRRVILFAASAYTAYLLAIDFQIAYAAMTWVPAPAVVTHIAAAPLNTGYADDDGVFEAEVTYRYDRAGETRHGSRVRLGGFFGDSVSAAEVASRYAPGDNVTVYVDPNDPDLSVLTNDVDMTFFLLTLRSMAIFAAIYFFMFVWQPRRLNWISSYANWY